MNIEKERELFERWCVKDDEFCIHRYAGDDKYSEWDTQAAWEAWLASASREGYKMVPAEPTDRILISLYKHINCFNGDDFTLTSDIYKAMLGAVE